MQAGLLVSPTKKQAVDCCTNRSASRQCYWHHTLAFNTAALSRKLHRRRLYSMRRCRPSLSQPRSGVGSAGSTSITVGPAQLEGPTTSGAGGTRGGHGPWPCSTWNGDNHGGHGPGMCSGQTGPCGGAGAIGASTAQRRRPPRPPTCIRSPRRLPWRSPARRSPRR
jgi:hypothetical protein